MVPHAMWFTSTVSCKSRWNPKSVKSRQVLSFQRKRTKTTMSNGKMCYLATRWQYNMTCGRSGINTVHKSNFFRLLNWNQGPPSQSTKFLCRILLTWKEITQYIVLNLDKWSNVWLSGQSFTVFSFRSWLGQRTVWPLGNIIDIAIMKQKWHVLLLS